MIEEFKEFAIKGNVMGIAIAVIIGGAFEKIISSFVNDFIMPILGIILGGIDFTNLKLIIVPSDIYGTEVAIRYGAFIQTIFVFFIIAIFVFLSIKIISSYNKKVKEASSIPIKPSNQEILLGEIRDLLYEVSKEGSLTR